MNYPDTIETDVPTSAAATMAGCIAEQMRLQFAKTIDEANPDELFRAAAMALRPWLVNGLMATAERQEKADAKSALVDLLPPAVQASNRSLEHC